MAAVMGSTDLAAQLKHCIEISEGVRAGGHTTTDYQHQLLRLEIWRWRLKRWGELVSVPHASPSYSDRAQHHARQPSLDEQAHAKRLLGGILGAFAQAEKTAVRVDTAGVDGEPGNAQLAIRNRIRTAAITPQQPRTAPRTKRGWALRSAKELDDLIKTIIAHVDGLERLNPSVARAMYSRVSTVLDEVVANGSDPVMELRSIAYAAKGVDEHVAAAALTEARSRSIYRRNKVWVAGRGKVVLGDVVLRGHARSGPGTLYEANETKVEEDSKALIGTLYGDKSFFDD